ncbi:MAG: hypothetical protein JWP13_394 [Candidatus Saccharibacteria bacterium]|nr:hypothetical protein [Candidatus Saccharibacteria bacterium]
MLHRSTTRRRDRLSASGFTLVELTVVITLVGLIATSAYTFFNTSFSQYLSLQAEGSSFTELATQSQRVANVLRGTTDILSASKDEIDCYAYFSPSDAFVSRIRYYKADNNTKLLADVTRMTANPPTGVLIPESTQTFTIIDNFRNQAGVNTFSYLNASGGVLAMPISDLRTIKGIQVTLVSHGGNLSANSSQTISLQVSLRNRKTNL